MFHLNPVKSLVQYHQTRMTLSFPTVPSAPPSESEKCPFNNINGSHLTAHSSLSVRMGVACGRGAQRRAYLARNIRTAGIIQLNSLADLSRLISTAANTQHSTLNTQHSTIVGVGLPQDFCWHKAANPCGYALQRAQSALAHTKADAGVQHVGY